MLTVILGKTCSGKTTVVDKLCEKYPNYQKVVTYTTRKPRSGEINGKDYWFISDEEFQDLRGKGRFSEYKVYHTVEGDWWYGSILDNLDDDKDYLIILTPDGLKDIQNSVEDFISIYLYANQDTVKKRLIKRDDDPNEASRRMIRDTEDFKGLENEVNRIVYNNSDNNIDDVADRLNHVIQTLKNSDGKLSDRRKVKYLR